LRELRRQGCEKVRLNVDAENLTGAVKLYERAGMHVSRRSDRYEKELR
jgi:ribosomal protein S18 acetylase RimI-like enzyme